MMRVVIAGESIYDAGGLGHFLAIGVKYLAKFNPTWKFDLIVTESVALKCMNLIDSSNVTFHIYDRSGPIDWLRKRIRIRGRERIINLLKKYTPVKKWRVKMGDLHAIWESIPEHDVIWVPHFDIVSRQWPLLYEPRFAKRPIIFTIHDIHPVFYPEEWSSQALFNFHENFISFAKQSKQIVTHSNFQKQSIIMHLGIEKEKISVTTIPPLLDHAIFHDYNNKEYSEDATIFLKDKYNIRRPYFLYPGSSGFSHKNHLGLFKAWYELNHEMNEDCPLLVCTNKGHKWQMFKDMIKNLKLEKFIVFTDSVPLDHLLSLYKNCDYVIVPSMYEGGGSGPVAEGILSGKPILCSRIPPIEEQLQSYEITGAIFFDPNDYRSIANAVRNAIENKKELENQAKNDRMKLITNMPNLWTKWCTDYSKIISSINH